jgi:hypothetical protein
VRLLAERVRAYRSKMSGPLLDRIDVHVVLPPVPVEHAAGGRRGGSSAVCARVEKGPRKSSAIEPTEARSAQPTNARCSRAMSSASLCPARHGARMLSAASVERLALSARAYGKVLRVARTIADLDGSPACDLLTSRRPSAFACSIAARSPWLPEPRFTCARRMPGARDELPKGGSDTKGRTIMLEQIVDKMRALKG